MSSNNILTQTLLKYLISTTSIHNISKDKTSSFILKNNSIKTYCSDIKDKDETIILKE